MFSIWDFFIVFVRKVENYCATYFTRVLEKYAECEEPLKAWFHEVNKANGVSINQLKVDFPNASILKENKIVFNIKGNKFRLIVKINFEFQIIWILFVGTHAQYDKINANKL